MSIVYIRLFIGSNMLLELGIRSYELSYSLSTLLHLMQTHLSLFTLAALHLSTSWFMLMIGLSQVVTPHLLTLLFGNLTLNCPLRISSDYLTSLELRFRLPPQAFSYLSKSMSLIFSANIKCLAPNLYPHCLPWVLP